MKDCVLVQDGVAHQIWRKEALPPLHSGLLIVEVESGTVREGDLWNGRYFEPRPKVMHNARN